MRTKILVTGANGQLARTIHDLYKENKTDLDFVFAKKKELDIYDETTVKSFLSNTKFDYCINCAAYTNVENAEKNSALAFQVNAEAVLNLAKACHKLNTTLIHISTDYVFDGTKTTPYKSSDKENPINEYGKSKLLGERYIKEAMTNYFIIRTSWLYSKDYGNNFYRLILKKANKGEAIRVVNNQISCPTNCQDLSAYILHLITISSKDFGVHHFSGRSQMSWYDFAIEIVKENNLLESTDIAIDNNYVTFAKRPKYSVLQNTKAKASK